MDPIPPQPGSSIDPRHAVGRRDTTRRARRDLLRGNNLALTDPRRMGKTVWLDLFCSDPGPGMSAIKIDYEGVKSSGEFLTRTLKGLRSHTALPHRARTKLGTFFQGWEVEAGVGPISIRPTVGHKSTQELLEMTMGAVAEALDEGKLLVIAMDEVPMAIDNIAANEGRGSAGELLQTLRNLRRAGGPLRWIVCGSIGFHHVLRRCDATEGVVNDLVNLFLGPLDDREAEELAHRLTLGIHRRAELNTIALMARCAGNIAFLIHALAHRLEDLGTDVIDAADVEQAFEDFIEDRDASKAVTHLVTRLAPQYGERAKLAERVLDRIALHYPTAPDQVGLSRDELASVLDDLVDDHYLERTRSGELQWRYDVLRLVWVRRRGLR